MQNIKERLLRLRFGVLSACAVAAALACAPAVAATGAWTAVGSAKLAWIYCLNNAELEVDDRSTSIEIQTKQVFDHCDHLFTSFVRELSVAAGTELPNDGRTFDAFNDPRTADFQQAVATRISLTRKKGVGISRQKPTTAEGYYSAGKLTLSKIDSATNNDAEAYLRLAAEDGHAEARCKMAALYALHASQAENIFERDYYIQDSMHLMSSELSSDSPCMRDTVIAVTKVMGMMQK